MRRSRRAESDGRCRCHTLGAPRSRLTRSRMLWHRNKIGYNKSSVKFSSSIGSGAVYEIIYIYCSAQRASHRRRNLRFPSIASNSRTRSSKCHWRESASRQDRQQSFSWHSFAHSTSMKTTTTHSISDPNPQAPPKRSHPSLLPQLLHNPTNPPGRSLPTTSLPPTLHQLDRVGNARRQRTSSDGAEGVACREGKGPASVGGGSGSGRWGAVGVVAGDEASFERLVKSPVH